MNFGIERPWALYGILLAAPALLYSFFIYKKTFAALDSSGKKRNFTEYKNIRKRIFFRIIFRAAAWCMLIFALAGFSWETVSAPTQKNGSAVSLVFDISYSMTARDCPNNLTRLEAAASFASELLSNMDGTSASAVLLKGSGAIAIPLTEDLGAIQSLLLNLSPQMMSSPGSNLADGINAALRSFPRSISKAPVIWLFTDGEESEGVGGLQAALSQALRRGASVVIIGFGEEREIEIFAGDGTTRVKTALRSKKIREAVDGANKKSVGDQGLNFIRGASAQFVDATEIGSARKTLDSISQAGDGAMTLSYEIQSVDRHKLFIALALLFFALSLFSSEFSARGAKETLAISLLAFCFSSCSSEFRESKKILDAVWNWNQKKYTEAIANFSQSLSEAEENGDELIKQYALYGLSTTYLMQNENNAAMEKINSLSGSAPDKIRFAAFYNSGIIAQREGNYQKAVELFKNALLIDSTNVRAKVNLEISRNQQVQRARESERQMTGAGEISKEESDLQKSIFNRIREKDQQQWKNFQKEQNGGSALDY